MAADGFFLVFSVRRQHRFHSPAGSDRHTREGKEVDGRKKRVNVVLFVLLLGINKKTERERERNEKPDGGRGGN